MSTVTRREIKKMEYNTPLPKIHNGKAKTYEEVFINSGGEPSAELANRHLIAIIGQHPEKLGWFSPVGHYGVFKDEDDIILELLEKFVFAVLSVSSSKTFLINPLIPISLIIFSINKISMNSVS